MLWTVSPGDAGGFPTGNAQERSARLPEGCRQCPLEMLGDALEMGVVLLSGFRCVENSVPWMGRSSQASFGSQVG